MADSDTPPADADEEPTQTVEHDGLVWHAGGDGETVAEAPSMDVVGAVAHDLRGPLARASGYLSLAREGGEESHFDAVDEALAQLASRIEDLVGLAQAGSEPETLDPVCLTAAAQGAWSHLETDAAELVVEGDRTICAEPERLTRLLENLFSNALLHGRGEAAGDPGRAGERHLTVRVGPLPSGFFVADDGVGIPSEKRERVFDVGYSLRECGTGFGLASVAQVAAAHGWALSLTTSAEGGARFELSDVELVD